MAQEDEPASLRAGRSWTAWLTGYAAAALLLLLYYVLALSAAATKSATFDEPAHLAVGYSHLAEGDYRLSPANGPLPQRLAALPLLGGGYQFPDLDRPPFAGASDFEAGQAFLYGLGNDAEAILFRGRAAVALLAVALGLVIYLCSRELFGPGGGIISLLLFVLCPNFLAHGALITSDTALAAMLLFALWRFWRMLQELTWATLAASVLAFAVLLLVKMSAVVVFPMLALLALIRVLWGGPWRVRLRSSREVASWRGQAGLLVWTGALHLAAGFLLIWACYGFRYSAFPAPGAGAPAMSFRWDEYPGPEGLKSLILLAREWHLLPENYLYSFAFGFSTSAQRQAFLNGTHSLTGWWYFFPYCVGAKTTLGAWLLILLAAVGACVGRGVGASGRAAANGATPAGFRAAFYRTAPLWVLLAVYGGTLLTSRLNIGVRHALPLYPPLFVLAGSSAVWFRARPRAVGIVMALALCGHVVESFAVRPHYLAFFNALAGGPAQGYRHLVDSSLDWGQDLPGLRRWLDEHGAKPEEAYVAYFGTASLAHHGIRARLLPGHFDQRPRFDPASWGGGVYAISATLLQSVATTCPGPWTAAYEERYQAVRPEAERFCRAAPGARVELAREKGAAWWGRLLREYDGLRLGRLCAALRRREPDAQVGYSILLYRLTDEQVREALVGPPPGP